MKFFRNKNLVQKIVIAIVLVTLLNFCFMPKVKADIGGQLLNPIKQLATFIGDVAITVLQWAVTGDWEYAVEDGSEAEYVYNNSEVQPYYQEYIRQNSISTGTENYKWQKFYESFWTKANNIRYPNIKLSPELILGNKIEFLSVDFIHPETAEEAEARYTITDESNGREELRTIIASWYVTLRTIAIVGLLSALIYGGIRIIISSTAQDKAKYKQKIVDWLVAFFLLFFMHYIMAATVTVVNKVDDIIGQGLEIDSGVKLDPQYGYIRLKGESYYTDRSSDIISEIADYVTNEGYVLEDGYATQKYDTMNDRRYWQFRSNGKILFVISNARHNINIDTHGGVTVEENWSTVYGISYDINYFAGGIRDYDFLTDARRTYINDNILLIDRHEELDDGSKIKYFINYARLYVNANEDDKNIAVSFAFLMLYLVLVVQTGMFLFRYIKRLIFIAFFTLIAPMVAMTYQIDKIRDRTSTGF